MRLSLVKSKNTTQFYVIKSYRDKNGKNTSKIIEKLGNTEEVTKKAKGKDPIVWAKKYIEGLNKAEKENNLKILIEKSTYTLIPKNEQNLFNCGYLFLEKIYYELGINRICRTINEKYKFEYDLNNILSRLLYGRIIFPASKLATKELSNNIEMISDGKYKKANFNSDTGLTIEAENGEYIECNKLSIGTIDQLYLSLRLSATKEITNETIPIILDESFAYFDNQRLENVIKYLDSNYNNQIIIFTCTNREKEILDKLNIEYNLVNL